MIKRPGEEWISTREAAAYLGVSITQMRHLAEQGVIAYQQKRAGSPRWFLAREVVGLSAQRSERRRVRDDPRDRVDWWGDRSRRESLEPFDGWLTSREAADMLGCHPRHISWLVKRGRLRCYQQKPGVSGSRLYVKHSAVMRMLSSREWRRYRAIHRKRVKFPKRFEEAWEERGLAEYDPRTPNVWTDRDFGEFFTTRQVALMLGVSPKTVLQMRYSGRLQGYQLRRERRWVARVPVAHGEAGKWWYFRKKDVFSLMCDPIYRRHRKAWERGQDPQRRAAREIAEIERWLRLRKRVAPAEDSGLEGFDP
jgi:hypothetical protein